MLFLTSSSFTPEAIKLWCVGDQAYNLVLHGQKTKSFYIFRGLLRKKKKSNIQYDCMIHKVKNIYYLAIYRKSLPAPASIYYDLRLFFQICADSICILKENLIFKNFILISHFVVVQSLSRVRLFTTPRITVPQASRPSLSPGVYLLIIY